jgi:hypothetical protein
VAESPPPGPRFEAPPVAVEIAGPSVVEPRVPGPCDGRIEGSVFLAPGVSRCPALPLRSSGATAAALAARAASASRARALCIVVAVTDGSRGACRASGGRGGSEISLGTATAPPRIAVAPSPTAAAFAAVETAESEPPVARSRMSGSSPGMPPRLARPRRTWAFRRCLARLSSERTDGLLISRLSATWS